MLFTLALVWAGSFFFNGLAVRELPTLTIVLGRVGGASLILLLVLRMMRRPLPRGLPIWRAFFIMGFLNNVVPFGLIVWGQGHISSGQAAILNATVPLFTVLIAHFVTTDEKLTRAKFAGVIIGLVGVVVIIGEDALEGVGISVLAQLAVLALAARVHVAVGQREGRVLPAGGEVRDVLVQQRLDEARAGRVGAAARRGAARDEDAAHAGEAALALNRGVDLRD